MSDEKGFLDRWSARKRGALAEPLAAETSPADANPAEPADEKTDAEVLAELDLPDPETLGPGDDFKKFMVDAVPTHLRTRALRKLWISNPVLANLDELLDYGDDFTDAATVVENLQTAYKAGRGFLKDVVDEDDETTDVAEEAPEDVDSESDPDLTPDDDGQAVLPVPSDEIEAIAMVDAQPTLAVVDRAAGGSDTSTPLENMQETPEEAFRPRRMRFKFSESG